MLRAVGVPARMAVGYAQGELDVNTAKEDIIIKATVRRRDAHAWPEVYFPSYGWVEFEPTSNQDAVTRPLNTPHTSASSNFPSLPQTPGQTNPSLADKNKEAEKLPANTQTTREPLNAYLLIGVAIAALLIAGLYADRKYSVAKQLPTYISQAYIRNNTQPPRVINNWAQWTELSSIERAFQSINISLRWLGASQPIHATAGQRAQKLLELLPNAKAAIEALAAEHRNELFTPRPGDSVRARRAGVIILFYAVRKRVLRFFGYNMNNNV